MTDHHHSIIVQAIGLAFIPVHDMPPAEPALARRPVAAALITLQRREDGHREIVASLLAEADAAAQPLPQLIDQLLIPGAPTVISAADRAAISVETMARRAWGGRSLARLHAGDILDPCTIAGPEVRDEAALCRRLQIPVPLVPDTDVELAWDRRSADATLDIALGWATARMMLWAHVASARSGEPDPFFETLLPLSDWMAAARSMPSIGRAMRSRPMIRATNEAAAWRAYRSARDAGDDVRWGDAASHADPR